MFDTFWQPEIAKAGSGVMIALWPSAELASKLAIPDGEKPEELHVTIAYFGKELTSEQINTIHAVLERVTASFPPLLDGALSGEGRFPATESTEERDVLVRLADIPRLETLRERILSELEALGVNAFRNHGYCPHMTMAYVTPGSATSTPMSTVLFPAERLTLSIGKLQHHYALRGSGYATKANPCHNPAGPGGGQFCSGSGSGASKVTVTATSLAGGRIRSQIYEHTDAPDASLQVVTQVDTGFRTVSDVYVPDAQRGKGIATQLYMRALEDGPILHNKEVGGNLTAAAAGVRSKLIASGKVRVTEDEYGNKFLELNKRALKANFQITKSSDEQRRVFGWASVSEIDGKEIVDHHRDIISTKDMEEMAYRFAEVRTGGEMHDTMGVSTLIESMVFTKEKQEALGVDLGMVGWWVGFQVTDTETWKRVKNGELRSFSIGGRGFRQSAS
jgi:2'-5' RNA ligase/predicted GNAT family acetyltransferase